MNAKEELIGEDLLKSTLSALNESAPDLQHHLRTILRHEPGQPGGERRGASIHPQYPLRMRSIDALAVLEELKLVERRYGHDKVFGNRQINLLIAEWNRHVERLRSREGDQA
jgi:hypothetical protein